MSDSTGSDPVIIAQHYQLLDVLGQGGMGTTYKALDLTTQNVIAVKAIEFGLLQDWKILQLFEREAEVLSKLDHPAIPRYLNFFHEETDQGSIFYLLQELAPGKSLQSCVDEGWRTSETELKDIATQLLQILSYLHSQDPPVIHRDIKPHNIIRDDKGQIRLVDFGSVRQRYYTTMARGSTVVGTFGYMAPEQFRGYAEAKTDLYGVGATLLYLMLRRSPSEMPHEGLRIDLRSCLQISENWVNWLQKMLEPDLEDRFTSAKAALESLHQQAVVTTKPKVNFYLQPLVASSIALIFVVLGSNTLFGQYKWGILSQLGLKPVELCTPKDLDQTIIFFGQGGTTRKPDECLYWASFWHVDHIVEKMLSEGADVDFQYPTLDGPTPLIASLDSRTFSSINGNPSYDEERRRSQYRIPEQYSVQNRMTNPGSEPLRIVQMLVEHGADVNQISRGRNALSWAIKSGYPRVAEFLIKHGADVNHSSYYHATPLLNALSQNRLYKTRSGIEVIKLLIELTDNINYQDKNGNHALLYAADHGLTEIVKILVEKGADVNLSDSQGDTPLSEAVENGHLSIAEFLNKSGAQG
ncbi:MAG: protein kinase [Synechococcaceae cyanobacterium SM2_3_1]|nr:protein kinase [Synechococcaceae cyanobacterium SM2_3_1]